jgi:hyperosmotically inducible periplasmic protein
MKTFRAMLTWAMMALGTLQLGAGAASAGERTPGQFVDDATVTARVNTALATDAGLGTAASVNVSTYRGVVQLSGFVESEAAAKKAVAIAKDVEGVLSLKSDLRINPER